MALLVSTNVFSRQRYEKFVEYANLYVKNAINDEQKLDALILASNIYVDLNDFDNVSKGLGLFIIGLSIFF